MTIFLSSFTVSKALWSCTLQCNRWDGERASKLINDDRASELTDDDKECLDGKRCSLRSTNDFTAHFLRNIDLDSKGAKDFIPTLIDKLGFMKKFTGKSDSKIERLIGDELKNHVSQNNYKRLTKMVNMRGGLIKCSC